MDTTAEIVRRAGEAARHGLVKPFRQPELERYLLEAGRHARCKALLRDAIELGSSVADPIHLFFMEGTEVRIATFPAAAFHEIEHGINEMNGRGECWEALGSEVAYLERDWTLVENYVHDVVDRVRRRARSRKRSIARAAASATRTAAKAAVRERLHQSLRDSIVRRATEAAAGIGR